MPSTYVSNGGTDWPAPLRVWVDTSLAVYGVAWHWTCIPTESSAFQFVDGPYAGRYFLVPNVIFYGGQIATTLANAAVFAIYNGTGTSASTAPTLTEILGPNPGATTANSSGFTFNDFKTAVAFVLAPFTAGASLAGAAGTVVSAGESAVATTATPPLATVPIAGNSSLLFFGLIAIGAYLLIERDL